MLTYTESVVIGLVTFFSLALIWWIIQRQPIEAGCGSGHMASKWVTLEALGETAVMKLPVVDGKTEHCADCLSAMAVRCARCGKPIFPYQDVNVLSFDDNLGQRIVCRRKECAGEESRRDGRWIPPGRVEFDSLSRRLRSSIEVSQKSL